MSNNFTFVDRLDGYEYMSNILVKHIFDKTFADFMNIVQEGGRYFDISEKMMQVIESVDPLYNRLLAEKVPIQIHKPELIRLLLDKLDGKYDNYLEQKEEKRMKYVMMLYLNGVMEKIPVCGKPQGTVAIARRSLWHCYKLDKNENSMGEPSSAVNK